MVDFLTEGTSWMLISLVVMTVLLWFWALLDIAFHRRLIGSSATAWFLIVALLPLIGSMLYFRVMKPTIREKKYGSRNNLDSE